MFASLSLPAALSAEPLPAESAAGFFGGQESNGISSGYARFSGGVLARRNQHLNGGQEAVQYQLVKPAGETPCLTTCVRLGGHIVNVKESRGQCRIEPDVAAQADRHDA